MPVFPGADATHVESTNKLRSRPSETAKIPGAAKKVSITDISTLANVPSEPKPLHKRPS